MRLSSLSRAKRELLESYLSGGDKPRLVDAEITRRPADVPPPLSYGEQLLWLHAQLAPGLPVYNDPLTIHRKGPLDVKALEQSLTEIVRRHESWRTTFVTVNGEPVKVVNPPPNISLPVTDLRGLDEAYREVEAFRLAREDARQPFDLTRCPLFRAKLVRLGDEEYRLFLTLHHIIFDGISTCNVLLPELGTLYETFSAGLPSPLPELSIQYGDYSYWQRQRVKKGVLADQIAYWRKQLGDDLPTVVLPTDRPRPAVETFLGAMQPLALSPALTAALKTLSQCEGVTLFMTLLAAFKVVLFRYSGQEDIVVGAVTSGRKHPEIQPLLGFFLNPLVLRTDLSGNPTFRDVLRRLREVVLGALSHDEVPFELLVKEVQPKRQLSHNPLYQVLFSLEPPMPKLRTGWDVTLFDIEVGASKFDLYVELEDKPQGIIGRFVFNTDLFDRATVARMVAHWRQLLESVVADPGQPISKLRILTDAERRPIANCRGLVRHDSSFEPLRDEEIEQSIPNRFERVVERYSDRIAVKTLSRTLTYRALNETSNRIAHTLVTRFGVGEQRVALLFEHDTAMISGMLGALKAGKTYVPLDPLYPQERLAYMLEDSDAEAILTNNANLPLALRLTSEQLTLLNIDEITMDVPANNPRVGVTPDTLAYILYTSGSTGRPKGIIQNHRNVLFFIQNYINDLRIGTDDRLTLLSSYSFDAAIMDTYGALLSGALLCPIDVREERIDGLATRLSADQITIYHSTPTLYRHFIRTLDGNDEALHRIRAVVLGGEAVYKADVDAYKRHFSPQALFVNLAGQTESSVNLMNFLTKETKLTRNAVPLGYAVPGIDVLLLDNNGTPTELFGEIAIKSAHVALGYWRKTELTQSAFLANPDGGRKRIYRTGDMGRLLADGSIEFEGRKDFQVKIRGFRIELDEIESALAEHAEVRESVVLAIQAESGEKNLVAYVVPIRESVLTTAELRRYLSEKLPSYMVPTAFIVLDNLPLTPSGKVDRQALQAPEIQEINREREYVAPRDPVEIQLTKVWEEILGREPIGIRDNFFELGGHSILAVRLFAQIEKAFGRHLPLALLFQATTIEDISKVLRQGESQPASSVIVAIQPNGTKPPFFCIHAVGGNVLFYRDLSKRLGPDQPFYGIQWVELNGQQPTYSCIEEMAAHYIREIRSVQPKGPYYLGGASMGGLIAFEMACQLHDEGQRVALLALFDTFGPGYLTSVAMATTEFRSRVLHFYRRVQHHVGSLMMLEPSERIGYLRQKLRKAKVRKWWRRQRRTGWASIYEAAGHSIYAVPKYLLKTQDSLYTYSVKYKPRSYPGTVTLFRASQQPPRVYPNPSLGWEQVAHNLEIYEVPGYHAAIVSEPRVRFLIEPLQECLRRAHSVDMEPRDLRNKCGHAFPCEHGSVVNQ